MAAVRSVKPQNFRAGLGFMDDYWASFYLMSYSDGFRRRALIGSIVRFVEPKGASILLINAFAAVVLVLLVTIFVVAFVRIAQRRSAFSLCLAFAFCVSTLVEIYFEVFGDLLQVCLVLFAAVAIVALRQRSTALKIALSYGLLFLCFFIHEASIFFLAPCLAFLFRRWPRWQDFVAPAAAVVILLGVSLAWSDLHPHLTYHANLFHHSAPLNLIVQTKPFKALFHDMYVVKFGGLKGAVLLAYKVFRIGLIALSGLVALSSLLPWAFFRRKIYALAAISLFSVPLWIIAEDWGRFLGYNFLLAIQIASWILPSASEQSEVTLPTDALASWLQRIGGYSFVRLAALMVLILSPFHQSRVLGITSLSIVLCFGLILAAIAQVLGWLPDPLPDASSEPAS